MITEMITRWGSITAISVSPAFGWGERLRSQFILPMVRHTAFCPAARRHMIPTWAMTVHKSQGSEFDHTLLLLPLDNNPLLTRELLYTGITRARKKRWICLPPQTFSQMVRHQTERQNGLAKMLEQWP